MSASNRLAKSKVRGRQIRDSTLGADAALGSASLMAAARFDLFEEVWGFDRHYSFEVLSAVGTEIRSGFGPMRCLVRPTHQNGIHANDAA